MAVSSESLLTSLTDALKSATSAFPENTESLLPPSDGISLLDVKNELLLSYLHNLVFLILLKLQNSSKENANENIHTDLVKKLVESRVYLERGVRPLEGRLRYQIDQVLRAAQDASVPKQQIPGQFSKVKNGTNGALATGSESEDSDGAPDDFGSSNLQTGNDNDLAHRPNLAYLKSASNDRTKQSSMSSKDTRRNTETGVYKPPKINPTAMPDLSANTSGDRAPRKRKSQLLDEYIDEELSTAPKAQPSIGSNNTITQNGRGSGLSVREREKQRERTEYEEGNLVRLPMESKADRRKARQRGELDRRDMFGGEDWTGLGGLGDRIHRSVAGKGGVGVLQRREKRRATEDGPRGDGVGIGESFEKKRKVLQGRAQKTGTKRR